MSIYTENNVTPETLRQELIDAKCATERGEFRILRGVLHAVIDFTPKVAKTVIMEGLSIVESSAGSYVSNVRSLVKAVSIVHEVKMADVTAEQVMDYVDEFNSDRDRMVYNPKTLAKLIGATLTTRKTDKPTDATDGEQTDGEDTDGETLEDSKTPLIDVMLANIHNLTADERTILAQALELAIDTDARNNATVNA